jgi:chorismate mutase
MLCAQEIAVPGAPARIIRVMLHVDGVAERPPQHAYLGAAAALRPDLATEPRP